MDIYLWTVAAGTAVSAYRHPNVYNTQHRRTVRPQGRFRDHPGTLLRRRCRTDFPEREILMEILLSPAFFFFRNIFALHERECNVAAAWYTYLSELAELGGSKGCILAAIFRTLLVQVYHRIAVASRWRARRERSPAAPDAIRCVVCAYRSAPTVYATCATTHRYYTAMPTSADWLLHVGRPRAEHYTLNPAHVQWSYPARRLTRGVQPMQCDM